MNNNQENIKYAIAVGVLGLVALALPQVQTAMGLFQHESSSVGQTVAQAKQVQPISQTAAISASGYICMPAVNGAPVTVGAPNGGEIWVYGTQQHITWSVPDSLVNTINSFRVSITDASGTNKITTISGGTAGGQYATSRDMYYTPPTTLPTSMYRIMVEAFDRDNVLYGYDISDGAFTVNTAALPISPAKIILSNDASSPAAQTVVANGGANSDQADKVTALVFDVKATNDTVGLTDIFASTTINGVGNNTISTTAYLYDGSNLIASAAIAPNGTIAFTNINGVGGLVIPRDATKAFTIKLDFRNTSATPVISATKITSAGIKAVNSIGSLVFPFNITGTAVGNSLSVQKAGAVVTLLSKTTQKSVVTNTQSGTSTTILDAQFNLRINASGGDVVIGASSGSNSPLAPAWESFTIIRNGIDMGTTTLNTANSGSERTWGMNVSYNYPDMGSINDFTNNRFTIPDGNSVTIPVHASIVYTGGVTANNYAIRFKKINWKIGTVNNSTIFPAGSAWTTDAVVLP